MDSPLRRARFAAVALSALMLTGCATMSVSSYAERGTDFNQYRTYKWAPADSLSTGDPRLDGNPFFHGRIQADIDRQLAARGFEKTASARPDLLIHYHASVNERIDVNGVDKLSGYCDADDCQPYVYEAGTLLVDFVDARTRKVVWRGWAEGSVDGLIDNQDLMERKIDDTVARIFEQLPRRLS